MKNLQPFHLAIPVSDLDACRTFYREVMNCPEGRSDIKWVDFNLYGHQLVIHQTAKKSTKALTNQVDNHSVIIPHFGVVLEWNEWNELSDRLQSKDVQFIIEPYVRFQGEVGEQATMFFQDPDGNALEFKAFRNIDQLFSKN